MKELILQSGDVLHCTSNGILGKLIRRFTKGNINHTALVIEIWGELFIIDSQKDGTNIRPLLQWNDKYNYSYVVTRPKLFSTYYKNRAVSKVGVTPYDFISLFVYHPLYLITNKWYGKKDRLAENVLYCSEYIGYVFNVPNYWQLTPTRLYNYMKFNNDFITL